MSIVRLNGSHCCDISDVRRSGSTWRVCRWCSLGEACIVEHLSPASTYSGPVSGCSGTAGATPADCTDRCGTSNENAGAAFFFGLPAWKDDDGATSEGDLASVANRCMGAELPSKRRLSPFIESETAAFAPSAGAVPLLRRRCAVADGWNCSGLCAPGDIHLRMLGETKRCDLSRSRLCGGDAASIADEQTCTKSHQSKESGSRGNRFKDRPKCFILS